MGLFSRGKAEKGDYIEVAGYEQDVDTTEVLAVHKKPARLEWEAKGEFGPGFTYTASQESYLTEYKQGDFELVSERDVRKVHKGR